MNQNNNEYSQIFDKAYKNYLIEDSKVLPNMSKEKMTELGFRLTKEEFINKSKTDSEFSKKWGLKIEERELSLKERLNLVSTIIGEEKIRTHKNNLERVDKLNIPTKLITITYNDIKTEIYES